jgi:hypothetical protein
MDIVILELWLAWLWKFFWLLRCEACLLTGEWDCLQQIYFSRSANTIFWAGRFFRLARDQWQSGSKKICKICKINDSLDVSWSRLPSSITSGKIQMYLFFSVDFCVFSLFSRGMQKIHYKYFQENYRTGQKHVFMFWRLFFY